MTADAGETFARLSERFAADARVSGGTGFGSSPALRVDGRIFAMPAHGELVVKLPAARCDALLQVGEARTLAVGKRTMREWVVVEGLDDERWAALAGEALAYVRERD